MITIHNKDCLEALKQMNDNQFDLAIVDPPYGLGKERTSKSKPYNSKVSLTRFKAKDWDNEIPCNTYFNELKRVSRNWIIFGANYFPLSQYRNFIVWDKMTYLTTMSRVELAATSFNKPAKYICINSNQNNRIHPTQKPVALYKWILSRYTKKGDTILDTHLGSGSIAIACHDMGFDLTAYEIDKEYYDLALNRLKEHQKQLRLF